MSDKPPYKPRPGSIGDLAIGYLIAGGFVGATRCPARDLADGIDCEHGSLHASMNMAVEHGLVLREPEDGITVYSLPSPDQIAAAEVKQIVDFDREAKAQRLVVNEREMGGAWDEAMSSAKAVDQQPRPEFGSFSDGRFVLEIGESVYTFTKPERDRLFAFLSATRNHA
jgi:hypothetical protein